MISFLLLKKYHLILRQRGTVFELIEKNTGNTVGALDYSCHYGKHGDDFPTINLFMIFDRKYRNCGFGKVLMNSAKKYFRSHLRSFPCNMQEFLPEHNKYSLAVQ